MNFILETLLVKPIVELQIIEIFLEISLTILVIMGQKENIVHSVKLGSDWGLLVYGYSA